MGREIEKLQEVPMDEIDLQDRTFCMSFGWNKKSLCHSIQKRGLITPCLLRRKETKPGYQIVMGFRRLEICKNLDFISIKAFVVDPREMDDEEALLTALYENLSTRGLNVIERSKIMGMLERHLGWKRDRVVKEVLPGMDIQPSTALVDAHLSLLRLIDPLKQFILDEEVTLTNAVRLSPFSHEDQHYLAMVLPRLKLNENILKEFLIFLDELMRREGISLPLILEQAGVLEVVKDDGISKHQRTQRVRKAIWTERYPMLSRMKEEFEGLKKELHLPPEISLKHSPYFEEEGLRVSFRFSEAKKFKEVIKRLHVISDSNKIERLLEIGTKISE
jgi:ParB/RepB/Spo0J family partition protein